MGRIDDIYDMPRQLANERERLEAAVDDGTVSDADRDAIVRFDQHRDVQENVTNNTRYADAKHLRVAAETLDGSLVEVDEDAITGLLHDIKYRRGQGNPLAAQTMHKYRTVLRVFLRYLGREWADDIDGSVNTDRTSDDIDPDDLLTGEDVDELIRHAGNTRDEAVIEFLADTACRVSVLGTLRVQDVSLDTNRPTFQPNPEASNLKDIPNKEYPLVDSPAVLRRYLNRKHPRPDDPEAPFFHKLAHYYDASDPDDDGAIGYDGIYDQLNRIAERAGIEKPTNPHNFRHTAVTRMRGDDAFDDKDIQHRTGWAKDTQMWAVYDHLNADEINEGIWVRSGMVDPSGDSDSQRAPCPNCGTMNRTDRRFCGQCGAAVTADAREFVEEVESAAVDERQATDDPRKAILYEKLAESTGMSSEAIEDILE